MQALIWNVLVKFGKKQLKKPVKNRRKKQNKLKNAGDRKIVVKQRQFGTNITNSKQEHIPVPQFMIF